MTPQIMVDHDLLIGLKPQRISQRITATAKQAGITRKLAILFILAGLVWQVS